MFTSNNTFINTSYKQGDIELWEQYHKTNDKNLRSQLLKRFDGIIQTAVNKWASNVPRQVLLTEAKILAAKAFDTYNPKSGAALATHITNNLQPLSRIVYTYQNSIRLPESTTLKIHTYNTAMDTLQNYYGREPTTDELHQELGWNSKEIAVMRDFKNKTLIESGPDVSGDFFKDDDDDSDIILAGIYAELLPDEKTLFEFITGYNNRPKLSNPEIMRKMGISQAQLSYKKTQLTNKIKQIRKRHGL